MEPRPELVPLRREVERPGTGGVGLAPLIVLAAAMTSSVAVAAMALTIGPHHHCARTVSTDDRFARPAPPAVAPALAAPADEAAAPALDPACAPRVFHGAGDVQEWRFETCASAPMPRQVSLTPR